MQSTLLGLAIAIILALVAALVAPLVIDWNRYRSALEQEAGRLTGLAVRVDGTIDARILPSPRIKLRNVAIGTPSKQPQARAETIELELALGPLLRGKLRATDMHVIAPQINLGLDRAGAIDWPDVSPSLQPDAVAISHLTIENGRVILTDAASGSRLVLQQLEFNGDIRSVLGTFKGEGAFVVGDRLYGYRIAANRAEEGGGLKLRLGVDPTDYPLTADVEGTLNLLHGVPQFDGRMTLARPAGAALAHGQRVMSDPWHLTGKVRATSTSASLQDLALQYGPDERAINVSGKAELAFGEHPHLDGTISAREVDLDRALANPDETRRPPFLLVKNFIETFVAVAKPPMPADIDLNVDAVTIGGTAIQSVQGGLRFDGKGWSLNDLKFRAPGLTDVRVSGRVDETPQGLHFSGPASLESGDLKLLMAWLEGRSASPSGQPESLTARGEVTVSADRFALEGLTAALDQEKLEGRLAYTWGLKDRPATLDGALRAADLNVDALLAFAKAAVSDGALEVPREVALALNIDKATFAGIDVRKVDARVKFDAGVLRVDRLSVADVGGAAIDISGHIDELSSKPRGRLTLDLDANALAGLSSIVGRFAPQSATAFRRFTDQFVDRLAPAKVHGVLTVDRAAIAGATAKLDLAGQVGALRLALKSEADGEPDRLGEAVVRVESRLDSDDGSALVRLLGLDRVIVVDQLPGQMTISAAGPLNGDLRVKEVAAAGGFCLTADGTLRLSGDPAPTASLQLRGCAGDLRPLQRAMTGQPGAAVPLTASAKLDVAGGNFSFTDLSVAAGKASLRGRFALDLTNPLGIDGDIEGDNVDAAAISAMLLGLPSTAAGAGAPWSAAPIGPGAFAAGNGAISFKFDHAAFAPSLVVRGLKGIARFAKDEIAVDDIEGSLAGGHLAGDLKFRHDAEAFAGEGHVELAAADAAAVLAADTKTVDGLVTIKLQGDSLGLSAAALIGSLHGSGTIALADAHFAGLDAAVFDAAILAADQSAAIEAPLVRSAVSAAMEHGRLAVPQGNANVTITAGQVRLANTTLQAERGAELSLAGVLDLNTASIDARMTLSGQPPANALIRTRPELAVTIVGPLAAPKRTLDISELMGWLTLRGAERQTRRLESIEANRRDDVLGPVMHQAPPPMRLSPLGTEAESGILPNASPAPGTRGLDRLHPETPNAAPDGPHAESASGGHGASAATLPAPAEIPLLPHAPTRTDNAAAAAGAAGAAGAAHPPKRRSAPAPSTPGAAAPAVHPPLDLLFRSQN